MRSSRRAMSGGWAGLFSLSYVFAAFFGALFYVRMWVVPGLGGGF